MKSIAGTVISPPDLIVIALAALLASGCATVTETRGEVPGADVQGPSQLSRAERVFLYQSRVADALLDHYPLFEVFQAADPALLEAEARMTESCSPLTQAVLTRVEGREPSLGLRFRVLTTIDDCERAAREIDTLLNATVRADAI